VTVNVPETPASEAALPEGGTSETARGRTLLATDRLTKYFRVRSGFFDRAAHPLRAVDNVSLRVRRGETMSLVGESGCGKSTLGRMLLRLLEPSYGRILYDGTDITKLSQRDLRAFRRRMQIIFQDPYSSLNPRMSVRETLLEPLEIHKLAGSASEAEAKLESLIKRVGLRPEMLSRYPHEFSGGQRQRIGIARALAVEPEFIVCDEPVSALDVSIQAQIVNLLMDLQDELGVAYLFISHDLRVVEHMSHRVSVMYLGQVVETALTESLYEQSMHPYTRALLSSVPSPDPTKKRLRIFLEGETPSPLSPPTGCAFHPRCPRVVMGKCDKESPELEEKRPGHKVACFFPHEN
jgi:oligopeptide transport system ATP-binding protein